MIKTLNCEDFSPMMQYIYFAFIFIAKGQVKLRKTFQELGKTSRVSYFLFLLLMSMNRKSCQARFLWKILNFHAAQLVRHCAEGEGIFLSYSTITLTKTLPIVFQLCSSLDCTQFDADTLRKQYRTPRPFKTVYRRKVPTSVKARL